MSDRMLNRKPPWFWGISHNWLGRFCRNLFLAAVKRVRWPRRCWRGRLKKEQGTACMLMIYQSCPLLCRRDFALAVLSGEAGGAKRGTVRGVRRRHHVQVQPHRGGRSGEWRPYLSLPCPTYPTVPSPPLPHPTLQTHRGGSCRELRPYRTVPKPTLPKPTPPCPTQPFPAPTRHLIPPPTAIVFVFFRRALVVFVLDPSAWAPPPFAFHSIRFYFISFYPVLLFFHIFCVRFVSVNLGNREEGG